MLGFGLSDKNKSADYSCKAHAQRLERVIEKLSLTNISIVANDFGGSIALAYAIRNPNNVRTISIFNTWMWSVKNDKHFAGPSKIINSWLGRMMYLNFNAAVNFIMPSAFGNKKILSPQIHAHYKMALPKGHRHATYAFAKELMNASDWWQTLWDSADVLRHKKILIFWGLKDKFILPKELQRWRKRFPSARVITFEDAGHFVQEEKSVEMVKHIEALMADN